MKEKRKAAFPFKVNHALAKQSEESKKRQKNCLHEETEFDISLEDGNYKNRKSTIVNGYCTICGYSETKEL